MGLKVDGNTHYHGIGEENFLKIIDSLDDVKEAYRGTKYANMPSRRENYFLLVSEFKDENGNTIIVPVYIEEGAVCNRVYLTSNKIATVFGRDDFRDYINQQIKNKNLIRIKNKNGTISEGGVPLTPAYESTVLNDSIPNSTENVKRKQLEIIEKVNPAPNTYNIWIRKVEDIKTLAETLEDSDWADGEEFNPDLTRSMIDEAIESGEITVYSSYPIEQGVLVSPSYMEAASYSGDGRVYEKTVKIDEVAWIAPTQGMYANTAESFSLSSPNTAPKKYGNYNVFGSVYWFCTFSCHLKKSGCKKRRHPIRQYLFLEQNSPYFCQKPRKATALLRFVASIQEIFSSYETAKHFKMRNSFARKGKNHR